MQSRPKRKIELKKIQRFKKNKKRNAQPTLSDTTTQQRQWFAYGGANATGYISIYKKLAVQCSADTFVVNQKLRLHQLLINN